MDTLSINDTGNMMTEDYNFAVVSLKQGADSTQKCTVNLEILTEQYLLELEESDDEDDHWNSQRDQSEEEDYEDSGLE